ncbi:MAG: response regulator transcription factor [Flavobacteriales bacterium]|nr:response regulator transcription factor [Flavobacteriales bacterium]
MIKRIIIVDDHPIFLKGLAEVIQEDQKNCVVDLAHDGQEAIQLVKIMRPHLVILDLEMPGMNGLELSRQLEANFPEIKKVMLTMHNNPTALDLAMESNVMGYVLKENAVTEIRSCIEAVFDDKTYISPQMRESLRKRSVKQDGRISDLTPTELRVLGMIAQNMTSRSIADELYISEKTVSNHRQNIALKLGLKGVHMLLRYALENQGVLKMVAKNDTNQS